jgi:hypothetical protein
MKPILLTSLHIPNCLLRVGLLAAEAALFFSGEEAVDY